MITVWLLVQAVAAIILAAVGLFPGLRKPGPGLNRYGYMLLGFGAVVFVMTTVMVQATNDAEIKRWNDRVEYFQAKSAEQADRIEHLLERIDRQFKLIAKLVMATPKGPLIPVDATSGAPLMITSPGDDTFVDQRHLVEGLVSDPSKDVWVVVHPLDTSSYWMQPMVSVRSGGAWSTMAYFGRSGDIDKGKKFEVVAVANPLGTLQEGEYGSTWPKAEWTSTPVIVTRR